MNSQIKVSKGLRAPKHLKVLPTKDKGLGLFTTKLIKEGETICALIYDAFRPGAFADAKSIQAWEDDFRHSNLKYIDQYINHSCDPNSKLRFTYDRFEAIKPIFPKEEITFNYLTSEYDMVKEETDFDCKCGSENCRGRIEGFKYLNKNQQMELWPYLSAYLRLKICHPRKDLREIFSLSR